MAGQVATLDSYLGAPLLNSWTDISNNRPYDPSALRYIVRYTVDLGWWYDFVDAGFGFFQAKTPADYENYQKERTRILLESSLYRVSIAAAQRAIAYGHALVPYLYRRYFRVIDVATDEARLERQEIETVLGMNPILAMNFMIYGFREEIASRWLAKNSACATDTRNCTSSDFAVPYDLAVRSTYDFAKSAQYCVPKRDGSASAVGADQCTARGKLTSPFSRILNAEKWPLHYRDPKAKSKSIEVKLAFGCDDSDSVVMKDVQTDLRVLMNENCARLKPTRSKESEPKDTVKVELPPGWSVIFGGSAIPLPTARMVGTGMFLDTNDFQVIRSLKADVADALVGQRLFSLVDDQGSKRNIASALLAH
jgi:hypothetical protein